MTEHDALVYVLDDEQHEFVEAMMLDTALWCLALNLSVAGALCEAFDAGAADRWYPGCGMAWERES